ncbi:hypothetical protein CERZMDRAFT_81249 [Cercospora zeae-maydis SCOH1-5]|uniref:NADP-dependent oxidoreductase domain-containing protein n=1 Tax=Cercospora zeae-maydis SCOH1-5 TaxID=717836 RepID=A0A6A6FVB0_9PEZI|nr:hypothetical protein CERZMDRAFT_81249 [Cercospora zeae-maydis SCOH1-5]
MQAAEPPKSILGYHRILSPSAGVRVSPLCLGAMNFGEAWKGFMGECSKETAFDMLDYFYAQGGNFIDTANAYQSEESEQWLGEWMESRGVRDQMVIATKYTSGYRRHAGGIQSNYTGNNTKSLHVSLEASLKKMKTSYIDILYVHWWDFTASVPEVMKALNTVADQGKILYLGVSDTPAWIVAKANQWARDHGLRQFVVYQGRWSAADRDFEREIIPMCEAEGMGLAPWGALGGGYFKTEEQQNLQEGRNMSAVGRPPDPRNAEVAKVLEKIADRKSTLITSVALAYVMHKTPNVFPIVGGRKIEHLQGNIEALSLKLSQEDMDEIESAYPFSIGFPMSMLFGSDAPKSTTGGDVVLTKLSTHIDVVPRPTPIEPREQN